MIFSDDFNRSDQSLTVSNQWSSPRTGFRIVSNEVVIPGTGSVSGMPTISCLRNVDMIDQEAVIDVSTAEDDVYSGPSVRVDSSTGSGYHAIIGPEGVTVYGSIVYSDGSGGSYPTVLAEDYTLGAGSGTWNQGETHTVKLRVTGTTIELLVDNVVQLTVTDTQATSGAPGFNAYYNFAESSDIANTTIDNFSAYYDAFTRSNAVRPEHWLIYLGKESTEGTANNVNNAFEYAKTIGASTDTYYTSGNYPTLTYGTSYESLVLQKDSSVANHLLSESDNRNYLPPIAVWKSEASAAAEGDNAKFCMKFLILPEGFDDNDNPIISQWNPYDWNNFFRNTPVPPKYDISFEESSQQPGLYIMTIKNTSTVGQEDAYSDQFSDIAKCLMTDNTIQTFSTLEDAQAATNPSLSAVVSCDTGVEISLDGNLSVTELEEIWADTDGEGYEDSRVELTYTPQTDPNNLYADIITRHDIYYQNLSGTIFSDGSTPTNQDKIVTKKFKSGQHNSGNIYSRFYRDFSINNVVTKLNEIHPQGTGNPDDFDDVLDEYGPLAFTGNHNKFSIVSASNTQTSPSNKAGTVYGASIIEKTGILTNSYSRISSRMTNEVFSDLTEAVGNIQDQNTNPLEYPKITLSHDYLDIFGYVNGLYQFVYPDGSSILKLIVDGIPGLISSNGLRSIIQEDIVGLTVVATENGISTPYNYSGADATFTSENGVYDRTGNAFNRSYKYADGASATWEWKLPKGVITFGSGVQYINITTKP